MSTDYDANAQDSVAPGGGTLTPAPAPSITPGEPSITPGEPDTSVTPVFTRAVQASVVVGSTATALPSAACKQVTISNNTGVVIGIFQGGRAMFPVFPGTYYTFYGVSNMSDLTAIRADGAATSVTLNARGEA